MKNQSPLIFLFASSFLIFLVLSTPVFSTIIGGPIVHPTNGHTYYLLNDSPWTTAEIEAISLGGHLATINNAEENAWVTQTFGHFGGGNYIALWIGLNDATIEGTFVWASGEQVTYKNWHSGEPNAAYPGEDYAHINITFGNGEWVDRRDSDGNKLYGVVELPFIIDSIKSRFNEIPTQFALYQNSPNPFNPTTSLRFDLPVPQHVNLQVFDLAGRLIKTLIHDNHMEAGQHVIMWDGRGDSGRPVVSGVYFYRLRTKTFFETRRLALVR